jgi:hypothetical protein
MSTYQEIVLKAPCTASSNGGPFQSNYRWVLMPTGYKADGKAILAVEQHFPRSGNWGSTGGGWLVETLQDHQSDGISLQGNHWVAKGLTEAMNEAKALLNL